MRTHSRLDYKDTKLLNCPLCGTCYHVVDSMELHKAQAHPNFNEEVQSLSKYIKRPINNSRIRSEFFKFLWLTSIFSFHKGYGLYKDLSQCQLKIPMVLSGTNYMHLDLMQELSDWTLN